MYVKSKSWLSTLLSKHCLRTQIIFHLQYIFRYIEDVDL